MKDTSVDWKVDGEEIVAKIYAISYPLSDKKHLLELTTLDMMWEHFVNYNPQEKHYDELKIYFNETELIYIVEDYMNDKFRRFDYLVCELNPITKLERDKKVLDRSIDIIYGLLGDVGREYVIEELSKRLNFKLCSTDMSEGLELKYLARLNDTAIIKIDGQTITGVIEGIESGGVKIRKSEQVMSFYPWKYVDEIVHKAVSEWFINKRTWLNLNTAMKNANALLCDDCWHALFAVLNDMKKFKDHEEFFTTVHRPFELKPIDKYAKSPGRV